MASSLTSDIRHAMRGLLRTPQVTVAAVICLALGLGSTTAIYSAVYTALLRPYPFRDPGALVSVFRTTPHFDTGPFSPANYLDLREATRTLSTLSALVPGDGLLQGREESGRVTMNRASGDLFETMGVSALRGRLFRATDDAADQPRVAVLSDEFWRTHYGSDPSIVGSAIRLDGDEYEVIGVAPPEFRVPHGNWAYQSDVWVPLRFEPGEASTRGSNYLSVVGRLMPGTTADVANEELRQVMQGLTEHYPDLRGEQLRVEPLRKEAVNAVRGPLLLLMGAVGFVLLIAAANVASLLLARGVGRRREVALRAVLGAKQWDVVRPALLESTALTVAGTVLGLVLASAGVSVIRALTPSRLPQLADLSIDWKVLAFSLVVATTVAFVCGIAPAWQSSRGEPQDALRSSGRTGASRAHQRFLRLIVAVEVSLSLVLLLGAGLVVRGFGRLVSEDPGFETGSMMSLTVSIPPDRYSNQSTVDAFLTPALEAVRAVPGVLDAGAINLVPYENWGWNFNIRYEGRPATERTQLPITELRSASPHLFSTLDMRLVTGRLLTADDAARPDGPWVTVANEALVRRDFPDEDPIGKRYHLSDTTFATIVGIVTDIRNFGPDRPPQPELYWVYGQRERNSTSFSMLVRVTGDPVRYAQGVTDAIRSVDAMAAISSLRPMDDVIAQSVGRPRFYLTLLSIFAGVALLLSIAGLYGLMSYAVAQRTREIGVRAALGSTPGRTLGLVMRQGLALLGTGVIVGMFGGFGLTRLLRGLLYGVSPLDALTWMGVIVTLAAAGALAIAIPARRASSVDPVIALREE